MSNPLRQVRAAFSERVVRVYQAYSSEIATEALAAQTFRPPFKRERMTWVKPSFTWMMYRAGWGTKPGQERILAIDISRDGFEWALANSSLSHFDRTMYSSTEEWKAILGNSPVRIQWDPERTATLEALPWRAIQIGLEGKAVDAYVDQWISKIEDVTALARRMRELVDRHDLEAAEALRPFEQPYPLSKEIADRIGCTTGN
jgi:Domain of unknown function (DUF4291)